MKTFIKNLFLLPALITGLGLILAGRVTAWTMVAALFLAQLCLGADPLDTWTWRNPLPAGNYLSKVAYLNGQFFALGWPGTLLTSPDGITWTKRDITSGTDSSEGFIGIAYGNGHFVMSVTGSFLLESSDGINWGRYTPSILAGYGLTYINGLFMAIHGLTSPDGTNWTQSASAPNYGFTYGNGLFVGVDNGGIYTSTNGTNWSHLNISTGSPLDAIAYGNGLFVIPYGTSRSVLTSPDGTNWTLRATGLNAGFSGDIDDINFGNGKFISVFGSFRSSVDGIHWNQSPPFGTNQNGLFQNSQPTSVAAGNGIFVAVGGHGVIASSPDGTNWIKRAGGGPMFSLYGLAYGNGRYVALGESSDHNPIITSTDGVHWSDPTNLPGLDGGGSGRSIAYGNGLFVAGGDFYYPDPNRPAITYATPIITSPDGINWTLRLKTPSSPRNVEKIIFANGLFVAAGWDYDAALIPNGYILTSPDGVNWSPRWTQGRMTIADIAHGNGQFVAVGGGRPDPFGGGNNGGSIRMSADGTNWTALDNVTTIGFTGVVFANNEFVAVTGDGKVLISSDGTTWPLPGGGGFDPSIKGLTYGNGQFVAAGNAVWNSSDGQNWTSHDVLAGTANLNRYDLTYLNGSFWVLGSLGFSGGAILECRVVPQLSVIQRLPNGLAQMTVMGVNGRTNSIQASTNLTNWMTLTNVSLTNGIGQFSDPCANNLNRRFYRVVAQ